METLSDKITLFALFNGKMAELYREKDVKEFIKKIDEFDEEIKLTLIKIERRLESNDTDDWDIGLSILRDLKKRFEEIRQEKDKLAGDKFI